MFAMEQQVLEGLDLNAINRADLLDDPAFEIHIGGQIFAEKIQRLLPIELQRIEHGLVQTATAGRIVGVEQTLGLHQDLIPGASQLRHIERPHIETADEGWNTNGNIAVVREIIVGVKKMPVLQHSEQ